MESLLLCHMFPQKAEECNAPVSPGCLHLCLPPTAACVGGPVHMEEEDQGQEEAEEEGPEEATPAEGQEASRWATSD